MYVCGYVNKKNCRISGTENQHAYIEKSTFGVDFGPEAWFGHFSTKISRERPLQSMAIVIGLCRTNFCTQKLKRRILATFGFNRAASHVTQPKLHSRSRHLCIKLTYTTYVVWETRSIILPEGLEWPIMYVMYYQPQSWCRSCNLTPLNYYLWGAVKDKCIADKSETMTL